MMGRLLRATDFERVLRTRSRASSVHFAVHHVAGSPERRVSRPLLSHDGSPPVGAELSTGEDRHGARPVDGVAAARALWLGAVVPKRHARRAVTRALLKRQIRDVASGRAELLSNGLWVVRLRAPFDRATFPSAASDFLRRAARAELEQVFAAAAERHKPR